MRIDILTIFPEMVDVASPRQSLLGRAQSRRPARPARPTTSAPTTTDAHRTVDDAPFGGGAGMVMKPEPVFATVEAVGSARDR